MSDFSVTAGFRVVTNGKVAFRRGSRAMVRARGRRLERLVRKYFAPMPPAIVELERARRESAAARAARKATPK